MLITIVTCRVVPFPHKKTGLLSSCLWSQLIAQIQRSIRFFLSLNTHIYRHELWFQPSLPTQVSACSPRLVFPVLKVSETFLSAVLATKAARSV